MRTAAFVMLVPVSLELPAAALLVGVLRYEFNRCFFFSFVSPGYETARLPRITHVLAISNKNIQSPLDDLEEILNLVAPGAG